jgi:RHH-type proline utilization regulon transcriptional repressor/proline dehydrogenase/delta 1-pyrroline-5-carboxylate dehydrogenase
VLAVHGRAVWPVQARTAWEALPDGVRDAVALALDWQAPSVHVDAVLHAGPPGSIAALLDVLAQRPGPIVQAVCCDGDSIALERLVIERSISINTAAAGGNASLMTIG